MAEGYDAAVSFTRINKLPVEYVDAKEDGNLYATGTELT